MVAVGQPVLDGGHRHGVQLPAQTTETLPLTVTALGNRFASGVALLQVGIVLASISILVRYRALSVMSLLAGAVGLVFLLMGLAG